MNTMKVEKSFSYIPALSVSGSVVVSIAIAISIIISMIISVIIITPPGMA